VRDRIRAAAPGGGTAVVLGSGWLHDVPLDHLVERYRRVVLVDAVHPWPVRLKARVHPQVVLATADLSGVLAALWDGRGGPLELPEPVAPDWGRWLDGPADLVVSDLVLSQVALGPEDYARRRGATVGLEAWAERIQRHHLESLPPARRTLLLTDTEVNSSEGRVPLIPDLGLPSPSSRWTWTVAPAGEEDSEALEHTVVAIDLG